MSEALNEDAAKSLRDLAKQVSKHNSPALCFAALVDAEAELSSLKTAQEIDAYATRLHVLLAEARLSFAETHPLSAEIDKALREDPRRGV